MPGPGWYLLGDEEAREVMEALSLNAITRYRFDGRPPGPSKVARFEEEFRQWLATEHCLATNSCTSAMLAALSALGIGPGDEVLVPGYTFIATIAAVVHSRAAPVLVEVDDSLTMDCDDLLSKITPRTKAIIPVHMLGGACDMGRIMRIARDHDLRVIEDVAQACGGSYGGKKLGTIGDAGTFSFNVFKTITSGDGGALTCHDPRVYSRAFAFHDHGFQPAGTTVTDAPGEFGLNLRMHELAGCLALAQVRKLDHVISTLRRNRARFLTAIESVPGITFRRSNDPTGDCCTTLTLLLPSRNEATVVARRLGSKTLSESGRHVYSNMTPLMSEHDSRTRGCPFQCEAHPTKLTYRRGMLPATDDILARSVTLSVGVTDSYLGADFGIDILSSNEEIDSKAREFVDRVGRLAI